MSILITILFLLLLNGFFALSEMAIVSSSRHVLKDMLRRGNKGAENVLKILDEPGKFLSTIQVGITIIGTLTAAYGGATVAHHMGQWLNQFAFIHNFGESIAITLIVALITFFSVIIGELVPKRIALRSPETIAILVARPMMSMSYAFSPIVKVLDSTAEIIMKFMGIFSPSEEKVTEAELKAILSEGAESGVIEKSEHDMMQRIFRLDSRDAKSIMTHVADVTFISLDDTIEDIKDKVAISGHSRYPVIENNLGIKIVGVVQAKELLAAALSNELDIKKLLKEVSFISENTSCLKVLEMFKTSSIHLAVVIDEYGEIEGIVTASDIFEAIVGVLPSNYDAENTVMIIQNDENSWLVDGITPIDEINIVIGIDEIHTEGRFDTIAGFILDNIKRAPKEGEKIIKYGFSFEIVDMDGLRIDKILVKKL